MKILEMSPKIGSWGFKPRHLLIIIVLLSVLVLGLYLFATKSDAYEEAEQFARTNPEVAKRIGNVSEVNLRFLDGFHVTSSGSGGDASFVFGLKGERGESVLDVRLKRVANSWRVEDAYLTTKNEQGVRVFPGAKSESGKGSGS
jgi:hypothetical protein